jgi:uncharacterized membrane protein YhaH (DUF805 family)
MLEWYKKVFENYSNFNGRARRSEYWYFTLMQFLIYCALCILALITPFILIVAGLYALASIIPSLAVAVRRMHDQDKTGWMILVSLIPLIGGIWFLILLCTEGTRGDNQYGPDPKGDNTNFDFNKNQFAQ